MKPFKQQESVSAEVQEKAAAEFEFAERIYKAWGEMSKLPEKPTPEHVFNIAMMLNVQAVRLFRSIFEDCQRGEGFCANILCRSLFETLMALHFVLRRHVKIQVVPRMKGSTHEIDPDGNPMYWVTSKRPKGRQKKRTYPSVSTRAWIYYAYSYFSSTKHYTRMSKVPGIKRTSKASLKKIDTTPASFLESMIGPGWSYVVKTHESYYGMRIVDLARVLGPGMERWYRSIYGIQSQMTHGGGGTRHGQYLDDRVQANLYSDPGEIGGTMHAANALFVGVMMMCKDGLGFHAIKEMMINNLIEEFRKRWGDLGDDNG